MGRLSANLGMLWTDLPLTQAIAAAAQAGFDAIELHWPYAEDPASIRAAIEKAGLPLLSLNTHRGDVSAGEFGLSALPGREAEARVAIDRAFDLAAALGAGNVHVMAGRAADAAARQAFLANLRYASDIGRNRGVDVLIEPLNPHDVPGYYLTDPREAAALIDDCGRGNIRILFDCYHLARNGLDIRQAFEDLRPYVGHIQFAGVPDRAEPDHGAIDYQCLLPWLARMGYAGWFGAEYRPRGRTDDGLQWLGPLGRAIAAER